MCSYLIRLRRRKSQAEETFHIRRVSDFAAIRNARQAARDGDSVEVWRGEACIYADQRQASTMPLSAPH